MKKIIAIIACTLLINCLVAQVPKLPIGSGIPMADVKMKSVDGKQYSISDVSSKNGVLVMFSCNTCPYVLKYQSRTKKVIKEAKDMGFGVIIINSNEAYRDNDDSYDAMKSYAEAQGYKDAPYVIDEKSALADAFNANRTPECFLFAATGTLVYHGAIDSEPNNADTNDTILVNAMNEVASGKDVTVKESRSIGCMIKRAEM